MNVPNVFRYLQHMYYYIKIPMISIGDKALGCNHITVSCNHHNGKSAKFLLEIGENENIIFPIHVQGSFELDLQISV